MFISSKIGAKSFGDRSQDIFKYKGSTPVIWNEVRFLRLKLSRSKLC